MISRSNAYLIVSLSRLEIICLGLLASITFDMIWGRFHDFIGTLSQSDLIIRQSCMNNSTYISGVSPAIAENLREIYTILIANI
jgi:hypothetical protein